MRIRTIKPAFWTSEDIAALSSDTTRLLFIGLWNYCDDDGRGVDNPALIRAALFPLDDRALDAIDAEVRTLAQAGLLCRYMVDGRRYLHVCGFNKHQVINKRTKSQLPPPPFHEPIHPDSGSAPVVLPDDYRGEKEVEEEREREGNKHPVVAETERATLELVPFTTSPKGDRPGEATLRIFAAWQTSTGKTRARLDPKRQRLIRNALKEYPEADVLDAVRGWAHSPHHSGQNDRHTVYNDLELILRDAAHIEKFRDLNRAGPQAQVPRISRTSQIIAARLDAARAKEAQQ